MFNTEDTKVNKQKLQIFAMIIKMGVIKMYGLGAETKWSN
jgi:hypothetical protein